MEQITARRALELITDVVDRAGEDFVYEQKDMTDVRGAFEYGAPPKGCRYVEFVDQPSCLVGHVLHRAGVDAATLNRLDMLGVSASALADYGIQADVGAQRILGVAQQVQDSGKPWGEALRRAREVYEKDQEINE